MLYVGIDQHRKQLTVSVREETGNVILRRQVSTEWPRVRAFLDELAERSAPEGGTVGPPINCHQSHRQRAGLSLVSANSWVSPFLRAATDFGPAIRAAIG